MFTFAAALPIIALVGMPEARADVRFHHAAAASSGATGGVAVTQSTTSTYTRSRSVSVTRWSAYGRRGHGYTGYGRNAHAYRGYGRFTPRFDSYARRCAPKRWSRIHYYYDRPFFRSYPRYAYTLVQPPAQAKRYTNTRSLDRDDAGYLRFQHEAMAVRDRRAESAGGADEGGAAAVAPAAEAAAVNRARGGGGGSGEASPRFELVLASVSAGPRAGGGAGVEAMSDEAGEREPGRGADEAAERRAPLSAEDRAAERERLLRSSGLLTRPAADDTKE